MTTIELARKIATEHGCSELSDADLDYIIWEYTGYPSFWVGDPATCFESQLRGYFSANEPAPVV